MPSREHLPQPTGTPVRYRTSQPATARSDSALRSSAHRCQKHGTARAHAGWPRRLAVTPSMWRVPHEPDAQRYSAAWYCADAEEFGQTDTLSSVSPMRAIDRAD